MHEIIKSLCCKLDFLNQLVHVHNRVANSHIEGLKANKLD